MCAAVPLRLYGAAALGDQNLRMVQLGVQHGAAVKFPGSGGAVVGMCHDHKHLVSQPQTPGESATNT